MAVNIGAEWCPASEQLGCVPLMGSCPGPYPLWECQSIHQGLGMLRSVWPYTLTGITPASLCINPGHRASQDHIIIETLRLKKRIKSMQSNHLPIELCPSVPHLHCSGAPLWIPQPPIITDPYTNKLRTATLNPSPPSGAVPWHK